MDPVYRDRVDAGLRDVVRPGNRDECVAAGLFQPRLHHEILALGFTSVAGVQIAAGTFAAVKSFNASLFRPFSGFISDLFQRKGWTPLPFIAKELPYAPRLHWLGIALILITLAMIGLTVAGVYGSLHWSVAVLVAFGIFLSFGTGGTFALVPLLFPDRPGIAAGFIGGVSTAGGIVYPLIFASSANIHMGYLYVAIYMFVPFVVFYFWAARHERHPEEHGLFGPGLAGQGKPKVHNHRSRKPSKELRHEPGQNPRGPAGALVQVRRCGSDTRNGDCDRSERVLALHDVQRPGRLSGKAFAASRRVRRVGARIKRGYSAPCAMLQRGAQARIVIIAQGPQRGSAVARICRSMHRGQNLRFELGQFANGRSRGRRQTGVAEQILGDDRRFDDIALGECGAVSEPRKQVAAQQSRGRLLEHDAGIPPVRHVRVSM